MRKYILIAALAVLGACGGGSETNPGEETKKDEPLAQSKNSSDFNTKFTNFLNNYYHLKDAFVLSNNEMAVTSANLLVASADSLDLKEVKADSSIVNMARGYVQTVSAESKALVHEKDIEARRKSFQMISDAMYDLVRTIRFDKEVVYHQFCPMAFNDAGAYWLSSTADIKNPYFGKKMLTCGEVKDSIDFRAK
jgi:Cu(I)/Ag(I) efflux system membrane fusion protein